MHTHHERERERGRERRILSHTTVKISARVGFFANLSLMKNTQQHSIHQTRIQLIMRGGGGGGGGMGGGRLKNKNKFLSKTSQHTNRTILKQSKTKSKQTFRRESRTTVQACPGVIETFNPKFRP